MLPERGRHIIPEQYTTAAILMFKCICSTIASLTPFKRFSRGSCPSADISTVTMVPSPCLDRRFDRALGNHRSAITARWTTKAPTTLKIAWCTRRSTTRRISTIRSWLKNGKLPAPTIQRCDHATLSGTPLSRYVIEFRLSDTWSFKGKPPAFFVFSFRASDLTSASSLRWCGVSIELGRPRLRFSEMYGR